MINLIKSAIRIIKSVASALILICLVIFMVNNRDVTTISLFPLPLEIDTKIFIIMILFFLFGMIFGILLCSQNLLIRIISNAKDRRKLKKLQKQV